MESGATSRDRSRIGRRILIALALLPLGTAVAARLAGSTPQPAAARTPTAPVVFAQYLVDLGEVKDTPIVYAWYRFRNAGDRPIHVRKLHPSCGCLSPQLGKHDYRPGESGEFYLRVRTENETPGLHEYTVGFEYETLDPETGSVDTEPRLETLSFRVTLPERKVTVEPRGLAFYQLDGNSSTQDIVVRDFRPGRRLRILEATCASDLVTVSLAESVEEAGHRRHTLQVTVAGTVPAGTIHETIEMHTDDETHPILRFPLLIRGPEPSGVVHAGHTTAAPTSENDTTAPSRNPETSPVGGYRPAD